MKKGGVWHAEGVERWHVEPMLMQRSRAHHPEPVEGRTIYVQSAATLIRYARRR